MPNEEYPVDNQPMYDDPDADSESIEPTFPAPPADGSDEDVDLESWEWPGEEPLGDPAETLQGEPVNTKGDGLIPLADEPQGTPDYQLADAPGFAREGYTVPDELAAPKASGARRLVHWGLAAVMLGGLAFGVRLGWNQIRQAFGDFQDHVSHLRNKGNEVPQYRKLVEERINDPTRRSTGQNASGDRESDPTSPTNAQADTDGAVGKAPSTVADLVRAARSAMEGGQSDSESTPHANPPSDGKDDQPQATRSREGYTLQAIVNSPGGNMAMVNGKCVRQGQRVDGAVLEKVTSNSVTLRKDGKALVLQW